MLIITLFFLQNKIYGQQPVSLNSKTASVKKINRDGIDLFGTTHSFIKNIGQYGETMKGYEQLGKIQFGYEGLGMPVLFTTKGRRTPGKAGSA
jgi:hypothetical protein